MADVVDAGPPAAEPSGDEWDEDGWDADQSDAGQSDEGHRVAAPRFSVPARLRFWRSPDDQPAWARPALLIVALGAGVLYGIGMASEPPEIFYGAAARSMSMDWHNFFFGAFDPFATVTTDKLPGAFWVDAISVRIFGAHTWALILPHVVEGVLTCLVLYRAVRRLAGPRAGLLASAVLAITPVTVLLDRGNIADSLLILLLVLAADALSRALRDASLRWLLLSGLWVGLAFQAKMTEAWMVLPALGLTYLIAAPVGLGRRIRDLVLGGLTALAVSVSWMSVVAMVPAQSRPYVDGSTDNSVFAQVFAYNGVGRILDHHLTHSLGTPASFFTVPGPTLNGGTSHIAASWHRLLGGPLARDIGWLLPVAVACSIALFVVYRKEPRVHAGRACCILWSTWLVTFFVAFSASVYDNSYYLAVLSPAVAALVGLGGSWVWDHRTTHPAGLRLTALVVVATVVYVTAALLPGTVLLGQLLMVAAIGVGLVATVRLVGVATGRSDSPRAAVSALALAALALLLVPAVVSVAVAVDGLGPFDTPFEPAGVRVDTQTLPRQEDQRYESYSWGSIATAKAGLLSTDTSLLAAPYILFSGQEVVSIGGYNGAIPEPTLGTLRRWVGSGFIRWVDVPVKPTSTDPRVVWVIAHCRRLDPSSGPKSNQRVWIARFQCSSPFPGAQ